MTRARANALGSTQLTYDHFRRTGEQDCANVFSWSDFDMSLGDAAAIVDSGMADFPAAKREWIKQMGDDFEGLDPDVAYESWVSGWRSCAIRTVKSRIATQNPPRVFRAQKVVAQLQKETRPTFVEKGMIASSPGDLVENTLADYLGARATEVFLVLYLSVRNHVVGYNEYASGGVSGVEVNTSGIMRDALISGAAGIITIHNHPTGDATPSAEDKMLWERLREAGKLIGIPVVDNMVIGESEYFSEMEKSVRRLKRSS